MQQQQQQQNMTATAAAASSLLLPFPYKLYEMIEYASNSEFSSSLSWSADGTCFIIHDKDAMMDNLAPKFFKLTQYRSFTRQLYLYGFVSTKHLEGEKEGGFHHKDFRRGQPELLKEINRIKVKRGMNGASAIKSKAPTSVSSQSANYEYKAISNSKTANDATETESSSSSSKVDSNAIYFSVPSNFADQPRVPPAPTLPAQCYIDGPSTSYEAEPNVQPFSEDELIYLESIFHKDEIHSNDNDLCSILSL